MELGHLGNWEKPLSFQAETWQCTLSVEDVKLGAAKKMTELIVAPHLRTTKKL